MSAQIIRLSDYRAWLAARPKPKKTHAPKCRACRQPGHYFRTCPDVDAYNAMTRRDLARLRERRQRLEASFAAMDAERGAES